MQQGDGRNSSPFSGWTKKDGLTGHQTQAQAFATITKKSKIQRKNLMYASFVEFVLARFLLALQPADEPSLGGQALHPIRWFCLVILSKSPLCARGFKLHHTE